MELLRTTLRLVHIFSGTFWVGASLLINLFIQPVVQSLGPEGSRFMQRLTACTPLPLVMNISAALTTTAGFILYWQNSSFRLEWIATREGILFTIGSLAGILAFILGWTLRRPVASRMASLGKEIQSAGGPPTAAQTNEMRALQARMRTSGVMDVILLVLAAVTMSTARMF